MELGCTKYFILKKKLSVLIQIVQLISVNANISDVPVQAGGESQYIMCDIKASMHH